MGSPIRRVALVAAALAMVAPASALGSGTIAGTITDENDVPLDDICVQFFGPAPSGNGVMAQANEFGQYEYAGLAAGSYKLLFAPCISGNYRSEWYDEAANFNAATPVNVVDGQTTTINEKLAPGGTISGTVTRDGAPIQGVCVGAHTPDGNQANVIQTDANGDYTLPGLADGTYRVRFSRDCNSASPNIVTEFWNDKPDFASATPVVVSLTASPTGIDADVEAGGGIAGTVTEQTGGAPVNNFCARAQELDGDFVGGTANTDAAGDYEIKGLPPGDYKVRFISCSNNHNLLPEYWDGKDTFAAADAITVAQATTTNGISPTLRGGGSITGRVTSDVPGGGLAGICVYAQGDATQTFQGDETDSNGDYVITGLATDGYKVRFDRCHGQLYRPEHYDGKSGSSTADLVPVTAGAVTPSIDAELTFDDVPPETTIRSGPTGTTASRVAGFALAADADAVRGECRLDGGPWQTCLNSVSYSNLANGSHTFEVKAVDAVGNTDPTPATRTWIVDPDSTTSSVQATAPPGGQVSNDPTNAGPSPALPVTTAVTSPTGGAVTITQNSAPTQPAPSGFQLFGSEIVIDVPPATVADPIRVTFVVDASRIPAGTDLATVSVVRDGVLAGNCPSSVTANPDPCVVLRANRPGGDIAITVLTSHASTWSMVRVAPTVLPPPPPGVDPAVCAGARRALAQAEKKVKAARKALAKAKKGGKVKKVKKAKAKLKAAKKKLGSAEDRVSESC